jgi:phosphoserine phosphatase
MKPLDLIAFDVDGTLVRHPTGRVIWEILNLRYGGSDERNRERYGRFRSGDITYAQWVEMDVSDWIAGGATRDEIMESVAEFELIDGAREAVHELKDRGHRLAVISGTIDVVLDGLFPDHPFDIVHTNRVFFDASGRLESWRATLYDGPGKVDALRMITESHGVPLAQSAFVGDGENDEDLLGVAGFFVAYRPRSQRLAKEADVVIDDDTLRGLPDIFDARHRGGR